jgi:hypothetical protein
MLYGLYPSDAPESRRQNAMANRKLAKTTQEFDERFDDGEDIHELIDISKAKVVRHGRKIRITLDGQKTCSRKSIASEIP